MATILLMCLFQAPQRDREIFGAELFLSLCPYVLESTDARDGQSLVSLA